RRQRALGEDPPERGDRVVLQVERLVHGFSILPLPPGRSREERGLRSRCPRSLPVANHDEPSRDVPHELYPEWTTKPPAVHTKDTPHAPPRPVDRGERSAWRSLAALALLVLSIALLLVVGRSPFQPRTSYESPDAQIEVVARERLANQPDLA